jgi:hypothetical protein
LKHLFYSGGWKKFEPIWNFMIKTKNLNEMLPLLESILAKVNPKDNLTTGLDEASTNQKIEVITQLNDTKY